MLLPDPGDEVDLAALYGAVPRPAPEGRPWVLINMVASLDGATSVDGVSGSLGGDGDHDVFSALRAVPDVILVAGGTARAEDYGPPMLPDDAQATRMARGQAALPRLAVVSGSLDLDPASRLFGGDEHPIVLTRATADNHRRTALDSVAEVVEAGTDTVAIAPALRLLHERGARVVLCEGGPTLNGQLLDADLIDEVCLTIAPELVGGDSKRIVDGAPAVRNGFALAHLLEQEGVLFVRSTRVR